ARTATPAPTFTSEAIATAATGLISDCPAPTLPAIGSGATLTLHPDNGPAGTQVTVDITGLQPGCQLWLGQTVEPCTCETGGYVAPAPKSVGGYLKWVAVPAAGKVHTTLCVCHPTYAYVPGYPPYPYAIPAPGGGNVSAYGPEPGDHFYISITGATIADPPPLFALFSVTQ
ncbi:MAG TPA: hypothetical protein VGR57_17040, partial [Ktedonobacterales bacterium]|nr:hypothetical protein [Ktedonobacterales bacterium]